MAFSFSVCLPATAAIKDETRSIHDPSGEICAKTPDEILRYQVIANLVEALGGLGGLEGRFKLTGIAGSLAKTRIQFTSEVRGFIVQINRNPVKRAHLCYIESQPKILRLRIERPLVPENGLIMVKPPKTEDAGNVLFVAANASNWGFLKFKRIQSTEDQP